MVERVKKKIGSIDILFPTPVALVVCGDREALNISTVAWIGMFSSKPNILGISLHESRHSTQIIKEQKEFSVNLASKDMMNIVDYCGIVSGREHDKFSETGLSPVWGSMIDTAIIMECPFNLECTLVDTIKIGKWVLFLGEIVETYVDQDKIDSDDKILISEIDPIAYIPTIREYWSLNEKLGDSFSVGKKLCAQNIGKEDGLKKT